MNNKRIIYTLLCSTLIFGVATGCEKNKNENVIDKLSVSQDSNNSAEVPDSVKEKLAEAHDIISINPSNSKPTDEEVLSSIYINGNQLSMPFTLNDLGDAFQLVDNEEHSIMYDENKHQLKATITYYGKAVGTVRIDECNDVSNASDCPVESIVFTKDFDTTAVFPCSINGVSIDDNAERMLENLSFAEVLSKDSSDGSKFYSVSYDENNFKIYCSCMGDSVNIVSFNRHK